MRRLGIVVGAGVLILLTGACGSTPENQDDPGQARPTETTEHTEQPEQSETVPPTESVPDRQPARTPPSGGERVAPQQIDATALPASYPVLVWTEHDGRTLGVVAQEGGCGKASVELAESADQVAVTLVETVPADARPCTMDLRYPKLTAELDQPLDQRTVVLTSARRTG